jgi:hypothetical protein
VESEAEFQLTDTEVDPLSEEATTLDGATNDAMAAAAEPLPEAVQYANERPETASTATAAISGRERRRIG